ncbi:MAG: PQQ-binding-like beta-propeller repeat protein [Desulfosalsimonadaceae bacterium]|nr:PQQ-binding-like beta-propeller repeat protein [Desulfosalsimonadaceae bacterium]
MAHPYRRILAFPIFLQFAFLLFVASPSFALKAVQIATSPSSGIAPLEVRIICAIASNTSAPKSYTMDFGDGSEPEVVESTAYSHIFTHTYQGGFFKPVCTVAKSAGLNTPSDPGRIIVARWRFETGGDIDASPAVGADGTVYVGSEDGNLYAIHPETGAEIWRYAAGGEIRSSSAVGADGTIYFGSRNALYAVNANGTLKWSFNTGDYVFSSPAVSTDGRVVYVGSSNGSLYAINATGTIKWQFQTGDKIVSSPAIGHDGIETVVYVGSQDRHVYAVAEDNGALKWQFETRAEVYGSPAIGADGTVYVGECKTGSAETYDFNFFCINVDGSKRWAINGGTGFYSSPAIGSDGKIYVGSWDGYLYALNDSGTKNWSVRTSPPSDINSSPAVGANDVVYVGCKDGNFYAFQSEADQQDGNMQDWVFQAGDIIQSSPVIAADGTIYFGSRDDHLYAINPGSLTPADSAWPMFHRNAAHTGAEDAVTIPAVISLSPERSSTDVDVKTVQFQVNFSPLVEASQIDIDSFKLEKETKSAEEIIRETIEGFAVLNFERFNNSGYHIAAVFERLNGEEPLAYNTKYYGTIQYAGNQPADGATDAISYDKTFSWSFTTQTEPEEESGGSGTGGKIGCFINTIFE